MKNKIPFSQNRMENGVGKKDKSQINSDGIEQRSRRNTLSPRQSTLSESLNELRRGRQTPTILMPEIKERKLVLHFDVRNTVLVADSVTSIGVEQALNSYLTGVTWGCENDKTGDWEWVSDIPSLAAPQSDCVTYYKHLEKELVRTPTDRGVLRQQTGDFTQEPLGEMFLPYFEEALDNFEWKHPDVDSKLTMKGQNGKLYHYIIPAVFELIQHLHNTNRDFAIIIRTYGMDAPNVLRVIDHSLNGNHPDFPNLPSNVKVNHNCGHIKRFKDGTLSIKMTNEEDESRSVTLTDERNIYKFLSDKKGVCAFVDDFQFWQDNEYSTYCGKPLWVDPYDKSVQHIFFDDNIRLTDSDSIVDLRRLERSVTHGRNKLKSKFSSQTSVDVADVDDTNKYEDMCLVHADLLQSTSDIDYFVNKVKLCEKNYTKFIENFS